MAEPEAIGKKVTWAELFFDLVLVFAVTEISAALHDDHTWVGLARSVVLFVPLWWGWVGTAIHANTHDVDNHVDRLGIFAVGLFGLFMALAVPEAYGDRGLLFGIGYLGLRLILAALVFRGPRLSLNSFSVGLCVTGPLLVLGGLTTGGWRIGLWALAGLVDLATPALVRRRLAGVHFDASHLPERFGLFVIIALGESIVAIGLRAAGEPLGAARLAAVATAFTVACTLWWVYFVFAASAVHHAVATARVQTDIVRQVLAYGHLGFVGAIIGVAVGMSEVVSHPTDHLHLDVAALLLGGAALYYAMFGYTRWRMFRGISWTRLGAAVVCLALLPVAPLLPGLAVLAALAVIGIALNTLESWLVRRRS